MTLNFLSESEFISPETLSNSPVKLLELFDKETPVNQLTPSLVINSADIVTPCVRYLPIESPKRRHQLFNPQSKIVSVLKKTERTYNEAVLIYKSLKESPFYKRFKQENPKLRTTEALIHLSRVLEYRVFSPGTTIYRKGDPSNGKVYIVYSGKVDLSDMIPRKNLEIPCLNHQRQENPRKPSLIIQKENAKTPKSSKKQDKTIEHIKIGLSTRNVDLNTESSLLNSRKRASSYKKPLVNLTHESLSPEKSEKKTPKARRTLKKRNAPILRLLKSDQDLDRKVISSGNFEDAYESLRLRPSIENFDSATRTHVQKQTGRGNDSTSIILDGDTPLDRKETFGFIHQKNNFIPEVKSLFQRGGSPRTIMMDDEDEIEEFEHETRGLETFMSIDNYIRNDKEVKVKKKSVTKGEIFGEEVLFDTRQDVKDIERRYTVEVVGERECGVLCFKREDFEYLKTRYNYSNTKMVDFLLDHVPHLEKALSQESIYKMESIFVEETLNWRQQVTVQGQKANKIYLLFDGLCEVLQDIKVPEPIIPTSSSNLLDTAKKEVLGLSRDYGWNTKLMKILICEVKSGVFIGEEILFNDTSEYEYSVKASSTQVRLLGIEKETFLEIMPEKVQNALRKLYKQKKEHNAEILAAKVKMQMNIQQQRSLVLDNYENTREDSISRQNSKSPKVAGSQAAKTLLCLTSKISDEGQKRRKSSLNEIQTLSTLGEKEKSMRRTTGADIGMFFRDSFVKEIAKEETIESPVKKNRKRRPLFSAKKDGILRSENSIKNNLKLQARKENLSQGLDEEIRTSKRFSDKNQSYLSKIDESTSLNTYKFDFGREFSESVLFKGNSHEYFREEKQALKMRKNLCDRQKTAHIKSSTTKNSSFLNTPKTLYGMELTSNTWLSSPKTAASNTTFAFSPASAQSKSKQEQIFTFSRKEAPQKLVIEKQGRAYSVKNVGTQPLKTEMRESYPFIEIHGKSMSSKVRPKRNSMVNNEYKN